MIRTGFEGYVQAAGNVGNEALKSLVCLFRELQEEIVRYLKRHIVKSKLRKRYGTKNRDAGRRNGGGRGRSGANRV